jgi:hypothetical protein
VQAYTTHVNVGGWTSLTDIHSSSFNAFSRQLQLESSLLLCSGALGVFTHQPQVRDTTPLPPGLIH